METYNFDAFVPIDIEKSVKQTENETSKDMYVSGWASTGGIDLEGESINPSGIKLDYAERYGYLNYEHDSSKIIGVPTSFEVSERGLFIEGKLFKDNEYAQEMFTLAKSLKENGIQRKVGFSIEGQILRRNVNDTSIVDSVRITDIALTKSPMNPDATLDVVLKSFMTGHGITPETQQDAGALRRESIAGSITNLTYSTNLEDPKQMDSLWKDVINYMTDNNQLGYNESVIALQLAKGLSRKDAENAILDIRKNELNS